MDQKNSVPVPSTKPYLKQLRSNTEKDYSSEDASHSRQNVRIMHYFGDFEQKKILIGSQEIDDSLGSGRITPTSKVEDQK